VSAFATWFKEQYGRMPSERRRQAARERRRELEAALAQAQLDYRVEDSLHAAWDAALKGWNARKK
jgi:hypothetical protein